MNRVIFLVALCALAVSCAPVIIQECTDTVVCTADDQTFVCPDTLTACDAAYGSCETVPCRPEGPITCEYDGKIYGVNQSFAAGDGCNRCTCTDAGTAVCTKMACGPNDRCETDADCPEYLCPGRACLPGNPCPPCQVNRCIDNRCVLV